VQLVAAVESDLAGAAEASRVEAQFSPRQSCWKTIVRLLDEARASVDVCVFTITDDRIAAALRGAHGRGVRVRLVTDDEKSQDRGSEIMRLQDDGIAVAWDRGPEHMHHKFAVFDDGVLLTGSYNWTVAAAKHNEENIVVSDDRRLVAAFRDEFERLWREYGV
jgi:cardiolipin hydrolase